MMVLQWWDRVSHGVLQGAGLPSKHSTLCLQRFLQFSTCEEGKEGVAVYEFAIEGLFVCRIKEGVVRLEDAQVRVVFVQGHLILQVADRIVPTEHPCGMRCKNCLPLCPSPICSSVACFKAGAKVVGHGFPLPAFDTDAVTKALYFPERTDAFNSRFVVAHD